MKKHLHVFTAFVFGIAAIILAAKSLGLARETSMLRLTVAAKRQQAQAEQGVVSELQAYELVTVREAVAGVAWHYRLPVEVELQRSELKVAPLRSLEADQDSRKGQLEVLKDYEAILGFLSALSTLPYKLEVKDLCVGTECQDGFSMAMEVKGK